jgi:hypothetical protein
MLLTLDEKFIFIGCDDGRIYKAEFRQGAEVVSVQAHIYGVPELIYYFFILRGLEGIWLFF